MSGAAGTPPHRTARQRLGRLGEDAAVRHLERAGYRIVARNVRCRWGEIDIVAEDATGLVFVEVRTRASATFGTPEESITPEKAARMRRCGHTYVAERADSRRPWRIDLIAVYIQQGMIRRLDHYEHVLQ